MYIEKVKDMFRDFVLNKANTDPDKYYHKELVLNFNNGTYNAEENIGLLKDSIANLKDCEFDDETFIEQGEKVAGRLWLEMGGENGKSSRFELIFICQFKDEKIIKSWELLSPA